MAARYHPKQTKIYEIAAPLLEYLFANPDWVLDYNGMVLLLDIISKDPRAPNPNKIPYGQSFDAINNAKDLMADIGTGGTYNQKQAKQAICCSFMKLDGNYNLRNKGLIRKVIPHKPKSRHGTKWIKECRIYLTEYRKRNSNIFWNKHANLTRDS